MERIVKELSYPAKTAYQSEEAAKNYDELRFKSLKGKLLDKKEKRIIKEFMSYLPQGSLVLDLACGSGRITEFLLSQGYEVWGIDISKEMLEVAKKKVASFGGLAKFCQAEAENLPFEKNFFDSATCLKLFGHIPPEVRVKILKEVKRVTKGPFIVAYYISGPIANIKRKVRRALTGNNALWFPISKKCLKEEIDSANLHIIGQNAVLKCLSETLILLLN
jgi:ubiquinone/menaquinone biosynthesis C-methylase UbiE